MRLLGGLNTYTLECGDESLMLLLLVLLLLALIDEGLVRIHPHPPLRELKRERDLRSWVNLGL
jgi:hypothetical protein